MDNILRHLLGIFADAIRAADAEAKTGNCSITFRRLTTQSAQRALRQSFVFPRIKRVQHGRNPRSGRSSANQK